MNIILQTHLNDLFYSFLPRIARAWEKYLGPSEEEKSQLPFLPNYVAILTDYLQKQSPQLLLPYIFRELACYHIGLIYLHEKKLGFTKKRLEEAENFLKSISDLQDNYRNLPVEIREKLTEDKSLIHVDIENPNEFLKLVSTLNCLRNRKVNIYQLYQNLPFEEASELNTLANCIKDEHIKKNIKDHLSYFKSDALTNHFNDSETEYDASGTSIFYELKPCQNPVLSFPVEVVCEHTPAEPCKWCQHPLKALFEIDLSSPDMKFLHCKGQKISIGFCERCTLHTKIFTSIDLNGNFKWYEKNERPEFPDYFDLDEEIVSIPANELTLGSKKEVHGGPSSFLPVFLFDYGSSRVGGYPTWAQDPEYPRCPDCSQHMQFIGQVDLKQYSTPIGDEIYYAFICQNCLLACVLTQST